jgi:hypothetical protein
MWHGFDMYGLICESNELSESLWRCDITKETYTTMSTVGAATLLGSLVDLDMLDDEVRRIQAFDIGIGFGILEQSDEEFGRLDGPAGLGDTELLA